MPDWKAFVQEHLPREGFRGELEPEIQEELANHLQDVYEAALASGATEVEAEAAALKEIDDWEQLAKNILRTRLKASRSRTTETMERSERALRIRGGPWAVVAAFLQELRFTVRRLGMAPGFSLVVLLTLGLGIGATTAIFSVVKGVLLDPLPYEESENLVAVWNTAPGLGEDILPQSLSVNAVYEDDARVLEEVGVWMRQRVSVMRGQEPEELLALSVTDGVLRALRVQPDMGRIFTAEDIDAGSPSVLILSYRYWQDQMGADPQAIGKTLQVGGFPNEIVGVMPEGFRLLDQDPDIYLSLQYNRARLTVSNFVFPSLARVREGISLDAATTELQSLISLAPERYPGGMTLELLENARGAPLLHPLKDEVVGSVGNILWVVLGGVGIILLVACANVANLLLVRAESRERAIAVQSALGSPRSRMIGQSLSESLALGVVGGVLGIGIARVGLQVLRTAGPDQLPRLHEIGLDPGVVLFACSLSLLAGLFVGIFPLMRTWRLDLTSSLRDGARGLSSGKARNRTRNTLVVTQLALALVLLVGSGLMIRSLVALNRVTPGFSDPEEVLTFRLTIGSSDVADSEQVAGAHEALARQIAELPGVTSVGLSTSIPMDGAAGFDPIFVEDFPLPEGQQPQIRRFKWIGGGYHHAMGNPVIAGRPIDWTDIRERTRVVMVTESIAREFWGDPTLAVGRRLSTGYGPGDWREIIGVVGDVRDDGIDQPPVDIVFWPMVIEGFWGNALFFNRTMKYAVRSARVGTPGFLEEVQNLVWGAYPTRPLVNPLTMKDIQQESLARSSFTLVMLGIAAAVALLLGSIGIYGVISYTVGQRTRELGLRIAMGAEPGTVTGMVMKQGLLLALLGAALGLGGAFGATRLMAAVLFGVDPADPLTYALVAAALVGVALVSTYLPARKAATVDPMTALRMD